MPRFVEFKLVGQSRARPNQAHLAAYHVDQLRQLVDAEATEPAADGGYALVVRELEYALAARPVLRCRLALANPLPNVVAMRGIVVRRSHRAQFEHVEGPPAHSDARLAEQDRATVEDPDSERAQSQHGRGGDQNERPRGYVERPLEREIEAFNIRSARADERYHAEHIHPQAAVGPLRHPRHEPPAQALLLAHSDDWLVLLA